MKSISINVLLASTLSLTPYIVYAQDKASSENLVEARSLVKAFCGDLKSVLKMAMKTDGPIKALEVCNVEAGPIAKNRSELSGWDIARTSLKVRNEKNAPDQWELDVLQQFEKRKAAGEDLKTMEYVETLKEGDKLVYRYMKPIPTSALCLTCHGTDLDEKITNKVKLLYPNDQATGFAVDDIRGAFTLQKRILLSGKNIK